MNLMKKVGDAWNVAKGAAKKAADAVCTKVMGAAAAVGGYLGLNASRADAALPDFYGTEVANVSALATDGATAVATLFVGTLVIIGGYCFLKSGGLFVLNWIRSITKRMS